MSTYLNQVFPINFPSKILILFYFLTYNNIMSLNGEQQAEFSKNSGLFAVDVYKTLIEEEPNKNIIFSPFSIQTGVAMVRMGAEGETAKEIDRGLHLVSSDIAVIADSFSNALASYVNSDVLKIANKIYVMKGFTLRNEFNEILSKKFFSTAEEIDFAETEKAASEINGWVESKTNNLIKGLVSSDDLGDDTRFVLLNAIHFKGVWKTQFSKSQTKDEDFYLNESDTVKVPMMSVTSDFQYALLSELDAIALEMPYEDTDLSMLFILPNSRTGLKALEGKLATVKLSSITSKLSLDKVIVKVPKFKTEFKLELKEALQKLGMSSMFSDGAGLGKMFEQSEPLSVSKVIHKAFIEVNEEGTEAAGATESRGTARSLPQHFPFLANRPFLYAIKSKSGSIIFAGKYAHPN